MILLLSGADGVKKKFEILTYSICKLRFLISFCLVIIRLKIESVSRLKICNYLEYK